jgi:hypothetical protein
MTLQWQGIGGLFTRLGRLGHVGQLLDSQQPGYAGALLQVLFQYDTSLQDVPAQLAQTLQQWVRSTSALMGFTGQIGQDTIQEMVEADNPVRGQTFQSALNEVIRQMVVNSQTVARCTVSAVPSAQAGNTGVGVVVASTLRGDGLSQENMVAEPALLICTADSYTGGATAGREPFQFVGLPQQAGTWDWDWPQGSGGSTFLNAISASQYGSATGNLLTNGDFQNWTGLAASNWVIGPGVWNTDMAQGGPGFTDPGSLQINPTGVAAAISQPFGSAALGTGPTLNPQRSYAVNLWARAVSAEGTPIGGLLLTLTTAGNGITGGQISVDLVDGFGNPTEDSQGNPNTFAIPATELSQSGIWLPFSGVFRLSNMPPPAAQLRIRESVPITGSGLLIDDVCFTPLTAAYPGGPGLAIFSSATPYLLNDAYDLQTNNDRAGQYYCATFQALFDRLFGMRGLNLLLPSSLSPTIPDTLISGGGGTPIGLLLTLTRP